jgi:methylated-DNA-[protein]-cysteine S-methyltransferase
VVGRNGQLTGYAGGLRNKRFLLELEEPAAVKESKLF